MHTLATLICPETIPHPQTIRQLLLFFPAVFHYRAAEESPAGPTPQEEPPGARGYAPAPFGPELDKFHKLLADLRSHRDEYLGGYLATLSPHPAPGREEGSIRELLTALGRAELLPETENAELWQARLLLRLAELQEEEERWLTLELARSHAREKMLFANLLGEEAPPVEEAPVAAPPRPTSPAATARLLRAWGQLYLADRSPRRPWLLTTANPEAFALLLEQQTRQGGAEAQKILTLPLPRETTAAAERLIAASREALHQGLLALANQRECGPSNLFAPERGAELTTELHRWQETLDQLAGGGGRQLDFYLLPQTPVATLFAKLCRRPAPSTAALPSHGIVGLLL